jgi:hypothetical protein
MKVWSEHPGSDEIPADLRAALEIVLGDLQGARPIDVRVEFEQRQPRDVPGGTEAVVWFGEGDGLGGDFLWWEETGAELAVNLADYLQEQFFPETRAAWGEARPPCPGHTHPAAPTVIDGEAWWTCPATNERVARFGTLRRASGSGTSSSPQLPPRERS